MSKSNYDAAVAQRICDAIAEGSGLAPACKDAGIGNSTFYGWLEKHAELREIYALARERQNERVDDELRELAATVTPKNARAVETKFRMLTWIAGKRSPRTFGDRSALELSGRDGGPIEMELAPRLAQLRSAQAGQNRIAPGPKADQSQLSSVASIDPARDSSS